MLILVLILALVRFNPEGAPVDTSYISQCRCDAVDLYLRDNPTNGHFGTRAQNDIIVSCLATIVACTWTTIHPNIPAPGESGWGQLKQKVVTWIYALLAPEAITAWAMRQYIGAQWVVNTYNSDFKDNIKRPLKKRTVWQKSRNYVHEWIHGSPLSEVLEEGEMRPWTMTDGFFLQMGGYMRSEKGRPVKSYIFYGDLRWDIKNQRIDAPTTTKSEIQDRSKGDMLSKTIVILQTTWFIAQCISRWSAHLSVTELEVVTLGFAMLNGLTYIFWWHKPQDVGVPVFLETKTRPDEEGKPLRGEGTDEAEGSREQSIAGPDTPATGDVVAEEHVAEKKARWRMIWEGVKGIWRSLKRKCTEDVPGESVPMERRGFLVRQLHWDRQDHPRWQLLWRAPYALVVAVLRPLAKLLEFTYTDWYRWDLRVPMFHTEGGKDETIYVVSSIIASLFGLVHFIPAWFLDFPTRSERILWRISAGIITGQPIILGIWSKWKKGRIGWTENYWNSSSPVINAISLAGVPLYIIARLTLIIIAFFTLRDLSQGALVSIEWISFVPHL